MGKYIKLDSLWECETCNPRRDNKLVCNECKSGRKYFPDYTKLEILEGELVKVAGWVTRFDGNPPYCSNCNYKLENDKKTKHCPECGAKMISK